MMLPASKILSEIQPEAILGLLEILNKLSQTEEKHPMANKLHQEKSDSTTEKEKHPMLGRRCVIRTYSAGVHIGDVVYIRDDNSMEIKLENALRLWKWENGGLSLSAVANNGIKGGRLNRTGEVYLTNVIEMIPVAEGAWETYEKFIEDED